MPHNTEINAEIETARQKCYATSVTPLLKSSVLNWERIYSQKGCTWSRSAEKVIFKKEKVFHEFPKRRLNHSVLAVVIKLEIPSH